MSNQIIDYLDGRLSVRSGLDRSGAGGLLILRSVGQSVRFKTGLERPNDPLNRTRLDDTGPTA